MLNPDYKEMLSILLEEEVEFVLVGAYALAAHGLPRATGDIDIFVKASPENSKKVARSLKTFGAPMAEVSEEDFRKPGIIFQIGVAPRRIDLITEIDGVTFDEAAEDSEEVEIECLKVPVISKAKLIKNKQASGRPQDKADVERLTDS